MADTTTTAQKFFRGRRVVSDSDQILNVDFSMSGKSRPPVVGHGLTFEYDCSN